jgi:hypothetical protein
MKALAPTNQTSNTMTKVKVFEKKVKLQGQRVKVRRNTHLKNENLTTYQSKVMTMGKVFEKVKFQGQRSEGKGHGMK